LELQVTLSIRIGLPLALFLATPVLVLAADTGDDLFDLVNLRVKISEDLPYLEVLHEGEKVLLMRHQDPGHTVDAPYAKTSRDCPPFCVQPMQLAAGVETVGELEVLAYLARISKGDDGVLLIDSRTSEWIVNGMIPGAVNIPYKRLDPAYASAKEIAELLELDFGVIRLGELWNYSAAKTLVFYCNGAWCGQSSTNIKALLDLGYPPRKLKWYRGGMQAWEQLGLTTIKGETAE
jgi:rhodanese-related sulfurtransferase